MLFRISINSKNFLIRKREFKQPNLNYFLLSTQNDSQRLYLRDGWGYYEIKICNQLRVAYLLIPRRKNQYENLIL